MTKKEKEQYIQEFKDRMAYRVVMVSDAKWKIPLDEYIEQEKWARPVKPFVPEVIDKSEVLSEGMNEGILSEENVFETDLWYMRNRQNFDLSIRNGRRMRK